jgi:serine/threonine protein kinase
LDFAFWKSNTGTDIIHGDIKPQNVLIFKDATNNTIVKVADFGYSTLAAGEEGKVCLPKTRPWNAPEHHFGEFIAHDAKQTDIYSYGMLCLWIVSGGIPILLNNTEYTFDAPTGPGGGPYTALEELKYNDKLEQAANQLIDSIPLAEVNAEHRNRLSKFFCLAIPLDPAKRTSDLIILVGLLRKKQ